MSELPKPSVTAVLPMTTLRFVVNAVKSIVSLPLGISQCVHAPANVEDKRVIARAAFQCVIAAVAGDDIVHIVAAENVIRAPPMRFSMLINVELVEIHSDARGVCRVVERYRCHLRR